MRHPYMIAALAAVALAVSSFAAAAQTAGPAVSPATPPSMATGSAAPNLNTSGSAANNGLNTSIANQPGVPNTSTPGTIGTGASPSNLPGDSQRHPGFPGRVGSH